MVAEEAHTSPSVKDLIVAAAGVDDAAWEGTYMKPTGGILTVRSELGEPVHKIATVLSNSGKSLMTLSSSCPRKNVLPGWQSVGRKSSEN